MGRYLYSSEFKQIVSEELLNQIALMATSDGMCAEEIVGNINGMLTLARVINDRLEEKEKEEDF